jgi:hypothetical protein
VFERWRADGTYHPQNLVAWSKEKGVGGAVLAADPKVSVP